MTIPLLPFSRLNRWGLQYHGSIQNDILTLPNSLTIPWTMPYGAFQTLDLVKFDGIPPAGGMSSEQVAEGKEYRNYGLITNGEIGDGEVSGRWLHRDESNKVWSIEAIETGGNSTGGIISVDFVFNRFGYIVGEGVSRSHETFTINKTINTLVDDSAFPYFFNIISTAPNGKKALFRAGNFESQFEFFEISLSNLNITVTKIKSLTDVYDWSEWQDNRTPNYPDGWGFDLTSWPVTGTGWNKACPIATGQSAQTTAEMTMPYVTSSIQDGTNGSEFRVLIQLVRGFYNKNNNIVWISRRIKVENGGVHSYSQNAPQGTFLSIDQTWESFSGGDSYCASYKWGATSSTHNGSKSFYEFGRYDAVYELTIELMVDDVVIQTLFSKYNQWNWSDSTTTFHMTTYGHITEALDGAATTTGEPLPNPELGADNGIIQSTFDPIITPTENFNLINSIYSRLGSHKSAADSNGGIPTGNEFYLLLQMSNDFEVGDIYLSSNLHLVTFGKFADFNKQSQDVFDVIKSPLITPEGNDGVQETGIRENTFAAFQPETEELIRDQTDIVNFI